MRDAVKSLAQENSFDPVADMLDQAELIGTAKNASTAWP